MVSGSTCAGITLIYCRTGNLRAAQQAPHAAAFKIPDGL
jgi:hypothetical protein